MIYRFGDCALDTERLELARGGEPVSTEPLVYRLIVYLIENRDRVVSKDELIEKVWGRRIISDGALNTCINGARAALGDDGKTQAIIKTFPRRGFRFAVDLAASETGTVAAPAVPQSSPDRPSIAVLPFKNMSGDPDQEYFSDGLTEDVITALSLWRSFSVVARNSTFTYKGRSANVQQIARDLKTAYVLEGSVRRYGNRVRVSAQLIDGASGNHVWAEKFDREFQDIFAVQDEITKRIAATVVPELEKVEAKRSSAKHPQNLNAWDFHLRGLALLHKSTKEGNILAHEMFERALELDPAYGPAHTGIAYLLNRDLLLASTESYEKTAAECLAAARRAVELDEAAAMSRTELVRALLWTGRHEDAIEEATIAVGLNPSNSIARAWLGAALAFGGREPEAIPQLEEALELAPQDPRNQFFMTHLALAYLTIGEPEKALHWARRAALHVSDFIEAQLTLISVLAHLGRLEEADRILQGLAHVDFEDVEARPIWRMYRDPGTKGLVFEGIRRLRPSQ